MMNRPIAVFDSGVGGVSVLRALRKSMPAENFVYFGDSENAPYGSRPYEEIRELTIRHAQRLLDEAKALVIACNTATSVAAQELREMYPQHIIIGIEPALKPAVERFPEGRIAVMATETTLRERKFEELMRLCGRSCHIIRCPCPELVSFVERGELDSEDARSAIAKGLMPALESGMDAIVLGCTHYPFLKKAIRAVVGENVQIFDGAEGTAKETQRRISHAGLLREGEGTLLLTNSLEPMAKLSETLLNMNC